jgi:hypothetical protein
MVSLVGCPNGFRARYIVDIDRDFATAQEEDLILIAENTYPPREEVLALFPSGTDPQTLPEDLWWYVDYLGSDTRHPYAITTGAIEYYTQKIHDDQANHILPDSNPFPGAVEQFKYTASIEYFTTFEGEEGETFSNVHVVSMSLSFGGSSGPLSGSGFNMGRKVILTPAGEVLQVQGDGDVGYWIS